jgi:hypothetical protein
MEKDRYTFSMNHHDGTYVVISGDKQTIDDVLDDFKSFLLACTFSSELVDTIHRGEEFDYDNDN